MITSNSTIDSLIYDVTSIKAGYNVLVQSTLETLVQSSEESSDTNNNMEALRMTRFIVQKICVPIVIFFGVVSNILNIIVLTHKSMNTSTNVYLTVLAVFDTLYLIFGFTLSLKHFSQVSSVDAYIYWVPIAHVLTDMCSNVGVWQTITFTVERYIGVCHPIRGHVICTPQRARIITAIVSSIAIAVTVPEFFERQTVKRLDSNNQTILRNEWTEFAETYAYDKGYNWFIVTSFTFLPLISLVFFNGLLIRAVVKANKIRRFMSKAPLRKSSEKSGSEQQKITLMLISVALVFLICQFPGALLLLYSRSIAPGRRGNDIKIAANITNLLVQINSSVNFILYSLISTKFRRTFALVFCCRKRAIARHTNFNQTEISNIYRATPRTSVGVTWCPTRSNVAPQASRSTVRTFPFKPIENGSPKKMKDYVNLEEYSPFEISPNNSPDEKDSVL
ncbi:FMRFamide receptor [Octopus bimaculoides]|uniref:G-protein coupled receptors family 1 profile domain-containing protein n=1 Tax=Octopus bimaculoides TaxID=37653 RepID=A0A0L8IDE8_OCTBM|nr:FMRFamide receptor [Octopus bimaculoides]XP_014775353.1 FMRFamide receptor [Octopus bimaculoides]XP_014775361.1 FMRFamide receptor [Octopus bimaculoides]XP_052823486.1 FMRFamide receptor [Octopus bimaculoides]XP_052823487.1 FMRFamide receptor [Octopus bimaculoides]|eukprot:XP_014775344.1 PREDICTED: FMRFamide receptor-like [Octopus bimaculoides]